MQINRTLLNEKEAARRPVWVFVVIWGVVVMCHSHLGAPLSFKRVLSAVWRCPRSRSPGLLVISMKFPFCCNFNEISSAGFGFIEIRRLISFCAGVVNRLFFDAKGLISRVSAIFFCSVLEEHDESSRMPVCSWVCALSFGRCRMSKFFLLVYFCFFWSLRPTLEHPRLEARGTPPPLARGRPSLTRNTQKYGYLASPLCVAA